MLTLESFQGEYNVTTTRVVIKDKIFNFFISRSLEHFIDPHDLYNNFPFWIKIWESSVVLADYLARLNADPEKRFLEIGCGLGLVGIVASSFGHKVTMTEYNPDALKFARANALLNQPSANSNLEIKEMDWNNPKIEGSFDYIFGSEITYNESSFQPIFALFKTYLKKGGEIILVSGIRETSMEFIGRMGKYFQITPQKKTLRGKDKKIEVLLSRMKFRKDV